MEGLGDRQVRAAHARPLCPGHVPDTEHFENVYPSHAQWMRIWSTSEVRAEDSHPTSRLGEAMYANDDGGTHGFVGRTGR